jgi:Holliday junction resolvase-like predicted endonuclease
MNRPIDPSSDPERYFHAFQHSVEAYETAHPHWRFEVLLSLIKWGVKNLRSAIDKKQADGVSWNSPFLELHYPVEWDWKSRNDGDMSYSKQIIGTFTKDNTATPELAADTLAKMLAARFNTLALSFYTNGCWFEIAKKKSTPVLAVEFDMVVRDIEDKKAKAEALEELFTPFSIGSVRVDASVAKLKKRAPLPDKILKELEKGPTIPGVSYDGHVNNRQIWAGLVFEIQSLRVDYDNRRAYYPLTIGLAVSVTPAKWRRQDQQTFWDGFIQSIDDWGRLLIPEDEAKASIILEVNDGLKITRTLVGKEKIEEVKAWLTNLSQTSNKDSEAPDYQKLSQALESSRTPDAKGRSLEKLVSELFKSIAGFHIYRQRVQTETEEIDLIISNGSEDHRLKREEAIILVECKNWSSKCGKNEFVAFKEKIENRKGRCSLGFLVSWNGFADTVTKEMLRGARERLLIVPIDGTQIRSVLRDRKSFEGMILSAWDSAIAI